MMLRTVELPMEPIVSPRPLRSLVVVVVVVDAAAAAVGAIIVGVAGVSGRPA